MPESSEPVGIGDKVHVMHKRVSEKGETISVENVPTAPQQSKRVKTLLDEVGKPHFCMTCGEALTPVLILSCDSCGEQFIVEFDETLGKIVVLPMGKEEVNKQ